MQPASETTQPQQTLRLREAVAIIVGIVIGAGIFKAPSLVAQFTGSIGWMLAAWVAGGVISLIGALCYAELSSTYASTGGEYHFLRQAFGRVVAMLYAWAARSCRRGSWKKRTGPWIYSQKNSCSRLIYKRQRPI